MHKIIVVYRKIKKLIPIPIKVYIKNVIKSPIYFLQNSWREFQFSSGVHLKNVSLSIIILTHDAFPYTKRCIKSITKNTKQNYELIIIDNNSSDSTKEWLKKLKRTKLIVNKTNIGVAKARNQGIKLAKNEYIVFLDNDTVVGKNWDNKLLSGFKFKETAIVGSSGGFIAAWQPLKFTSIYGDLNYKKVDYVSGWCFAFPKKLIDKIGFLDENMGIFWHEDLEYCIRARRAGYKILQVPNVPIIHYEHKSQKKNTTTELMPLKVKGYQENAEYIARKFLPYKEVVVYRAEDAANESSVLNMITNNTIRILRQRGWRVIRRNWLPEHLSEFSFLLCNPFVIEYNGVKLTNVHQENDRPPRRWYTYFKNNFDYNLCISQHCINALSKGNFKKTELLPYIHGVDREIFNPDAPITKKIFPGKFKFLTVSASQPRKNTRGLIDLYCKAFKKSDNVVLIIKDYDYGQKNWILEYIDKIRQDKNSPQIAYYYGDWSREELANLYRNVAEEGSYISVHHAECYGLPILEAACSGCRVGITGWGGPKDFIDDHLFPYKLVPSKFHYYEGYYEKNAKPLWAEPDQNSVISWMRRIYKEKPNKIRLKKRAYALLDKYNWDKVIDDLETYFKLIESKKKGEFFDQHYWSGGEKSGYQSYQECEVQENNAKNLFDFFGLRRKKTLDLGCCFGYEVKFLNKLGANAHGCDISYHAVENAYDRRKIKWADITEKLPYSSESFDFVYSLSTFEHIDQEKVKKTLLEIKRVIRKRGKFFAVISIPNDPEFFNDKSHKTGESEKWWEKQIFSIFGNIDKNTAKAFYESSKEAKTWNWHIFVAEKK